MYSVDKSTRIYLYGFNRYSKTHYYELFKLGYNIEGIIDINSKNIILNEKYPVVYSIDMIDDVCDIMVIIMLQNAFNHYSIAKELCDAGISKILFAPMREYLLDIETQNILLEKYNTFLTGEYGELCGLPILTLEFFEVKEVEIELKREYKNDFIAAVPVEYIHTTLIEPSIYADIPISDFRPYFDLMMYLQGEDINIDEYIRYFGIPGKERINDEERLLIIDKRKTIVDCMQYELENNMDFFLLSAPQAKVNEKGYFNLLEGQHRTVFLISRGFKKIPIRIAKEEYNRFLLLKTKNEDTKIERVN